MFCAEEALGRRGAVRARCEVVVHGGQCLELVGAKRTTGPLMQCEALVAAFDAGAGALEYLGAFLDCLGVHGRGHS